ncbi:hypothetical protein BGZ80_004597 [Entomortierella chlamydospora]|uniref:F-box domain-containing protein n=1 Tax=Entomortierella chlamydospora TaxID=101097 RepID=A0A9P6SVT8_9FUNG|nr:hypothetical protein BGZ80_004597 [Entomortierella chlamydospora]
MSQNIPSPFVSLALTTPAVDIPEIVEQILSYLAPCQLRFGPNRVSRLWHSICLRIITNTTVWDSVVYSKKQSEFAERLEATDTLIYRYASWDKDTPIIAKAISHLSSQALQRIKKLVVSGHGYTRDYSLESFSSLKSLTSLHVAPFSDWAVPIDTLFSVFPNLKELSIKIVCPSHRSELLREAPEEKWPISTRGLRSLRLESMVIDVALLEDLLRVCSKLVELQLVAVTGWLNADRYQGMSIFQVISRLCPSITSFHFSADGHPFSPQDLQALSKAFPKLQSWSIREDYLLHLPDPMDSSVALSLIPFVRQLTTLDLTSPPHMAQAIFPTKRLHYILCEAPNLIHLKARSSRLCPSHMLSYASDTVNLWACRNLETLHVSIDDLALPHEHSASRMIFAYLVKCCPRLRDVCLWQSNLRLDLYSGFCLMSELKGLEKLVIATSRGDTVKLKDLEWLSSSAPSLPSRWGKRARSCELSGGDLGFLKRQEQVDRESWERAVERWDPKKITHKEVREAIYSASCVANVTDVVQEIQDRRNAGVYCWPHLETLRIRSSDLWDKMLDSKLRPHTVFQETDI